MTWSTNVDAAPKDQRKRPMATADGTMNLCHWNPIRGVWSYDGGHWSSEMIYSWYDLPQRPRKSKAEAK